MVSPQKSNSSEHPKTKHRAHKCVLVVNTDINKGQKIYAVDDKELKVPIVIF